MNKIDLVGEDMVKKNIKVFKDKKIDVIAVSVLSGEGIEELKGKLIKLSA